MTVVDFDGKVYGWVNDGNDAPIKALLPKGVKMYEFKVSLKGGRLYPERVKKEKENVG